jgi:hypothetical protein
VSASTGTDKATVLCIYISNLNFISAVNITTRCQHSCTSQHYCSVVLTLYKGRPSSAPTAGLSSKL